MSAQPAQPLRGRETPTLAPTPAPPSIFGRRSSGLVRAVGTTDAVWYGLNAITIAYVTFTITAWALYPGSSYEWSTALTTVGAICVGIVYALFASVYPRSGGEYVFLSRVVAAPVGFVISFEQAFWYAFYFGVNGAFFSIYGLSPLFTTLGIQEHNGTLTSVGTWFAGHWGTFLGGSFVVLLIGFMAYRGMGAYFKFQRWGTLIALGSTLITLIVLALGAAGTLNFANDFNAVAGSGAYQSVVRGVAVPHYALYATLLFMVWPAFSILFSVNMVSFSGEVKNVRRGPLVAIVGSMIMAGVIFILFMVLERAAMGTNFVIGSATTTKFPLPVAPFVNSMAPLLAHNWFMTIVMNLWVILIIPYAAGSNILYSSRALLAWSIDGMAPSKLGEVSARRHTPWIAILALALIAEIWLAIYSFTTLVAILSGLLGFAVAFLVVSLTGIVFPFIKRQAFESSPSAIRVGRVPLMTIAAVFGSAFSGWILYRAAVDHTLGAQTSTSFWINVAAFAAGIAWFIGMRWYRRRQGVAVDQRFREIPIE
jgi:amino acid transporter